MKVFMETHGIYNGRVINHENLIPGTNVSRQALRGEGGRDTELFFSSIWRANWRSLGRSWNGIHARVIVVPFNHLAAVNWFRQWHEECHWALFARRDFLAKFYDSLATASAYITGRTMRGKIAVRRRGEWEPLQRAGWLSPLPLCPP